MDPLSQGFSRRILNNDRVVTDLARKLTERKYSKEQNPRNDKEILDLIAAYRSQLAKLRALEQTAIRDEAYLGEKKAAEGGLNRGEAVGGEGGGGRVGLRTAADPGKERTAQGSVLFLRQNERLRPGGADPGTY